MAKANVHQIVPEELNSKLRRLLSIHNKVPLCQVATLFYFDYGEVLDAKLFGSLSDLIDVIKISPPEKENDISQLDFVTMVRQTNQRRRYKDFYSRNNHFLWPPRHEHILTRDLNDIVLARSPYTERMIHDKNAMSSFARKAHFVLSQFADGLPMKELYNYIAFDKVFLGQTCYSDVVNAYPEIFYTEEELVFDGKTKTYDLSEYMEDSYKIASRSIVTGIYQKTLMLIKKANFEGLRLCVWKRSIWDNYGPIEDKILLNLDPIEFFLALNHAGMVTIKSHKDCKNDLRIHLPQKSLDCDAIMGKSLSYYDI